eukprot:gene6556-13260_t
MVVGVTATKAQWMSALVMIIIIGSIIWVAVSKRHLLSSNESDGDGGGGSRKGGGGAMDGLPPQSTSEKRELLDESMSSETASIHQLRAAMRAQFARPSSQGQGDSRDSRTETTTSSSGSSSSFPKSQQLATLYHITLETNVFFLKLIQFSAQKLFCIEDDPSRVTLIEDIYRSKIGHINVLPTKRTGTFSHEKRVSKVDLDYDLRLSCTVQANSVYAIGYYDYICAPAAFKTFTLHIWPLLFVMPDT